MNVTVDNLAPCKKLLRVEADASAVEAAFTAITEEYHRHAALPGFRKGKAPIGRVAKQYAKEIEDEARKKLVREAFDFAVKNQKLTIVTAPQFEEVQFARDQGLQFNFTVETSPEFEMPEYKGLPVKTTHAVVTPQDIERAYQVLRERKGAYSDVDRPVQTGDFVVVDYSATCEGKPLTELAPTARGLTDRKAFWMRVDQDSFLPGFTEQLVGAKAGEKRTVSVTFPPTFDEPALAGKPAVYEVTLNQVKERHLPEVDDAFAKSYGAENLEKLREGVQRDLENELRQKQANEIRQQMVNALMERVAFDLPESLVVQETRNVVYNVVNENQQRGVPKELIDEKKDEIYAFASNNAKDRVKVNFLLTRIAEKEGIKATEAEMTQQIVAMAQHHRMAPEKLARMMQERGDIEPLRTRIVHSKVLDFLQLNARIEEMPAPAPAEPAPPSA